MRYRRSGEKSAKGVSPRLVSPYVAIRGVDAPVIDAGSVFTGRHD